MPELRDLISTILIDEPSPDGATDKLLLYDASANALKSTHPATIGSGSSALGNTTFDVSTFATGGDGSYAAPWTGWDTAIAALFAPNTTWKFRSGYYEYAVSPNFGIHGNVYYKGELGAVLKYTGSGTAFNIDGSTAPAQQTGVNAVFWITVENLIIDGSGTGLTGVYARAVHHSTFRNVGVRNVTGKGFHFRWNILNLYDTLHATTRIGEVDGTGESDPLGIGFYFDNDGNVINAVQGCSMINLIAELCSGVGIHLQGANKNTFIGGSSEQNGGKNLVCYGNGNTFITMDNEYSGDADEVDYYIGGNGNRLIGCLGTGTVRFGNDIDGADYIGNELIGGEFNKIIIDVNAQHTKVDKPVYNFSGDGSFHNNSNSTIIIGAPIDYVSELADVVKAHIPGTTIVQGDVELTPGYGVILSDRTTTDRYRLFVDNGLLDIELVSEFYGLPISDDFSSDTLQWSIDSFTTDPPSSLVTVARVSNQLSITLPDTQAGNNFAGYANGAHDVLDGGSERIRFISKPSSGSFQFRFAIGKSKQNCLIMYVDGSTFLFVQVAGGSATTIGSVAFNAATMQYWQMRRDGSDIVAEYSADASTWTTLGTSTGAPFSFSKYRTCIEAGSTGSSTFDAPVKFDTYVYRRIPIIDVTPPSVPTMDTSTGITDTTITWNWTAATDDVGVTGYDLQVAEDAGFSVGLVTHNLGPVTTYNNTGLTASTTYYARVRAHDAVPNNSAYSSSTNSTTDATINYFLDTLAQPITFAVGLRKLTSSYAGAGVRVRRVSDDVEQDIGFDGEGLDWTAASAFQGASSLRVVTWYDQSGNGKNMGAAATASRQPVLDVSTEKVNFDGSDDLLRTASTIDLSATDKISILFAGNIDTIASQYMVNIWDGAATNYANFNDTGTLLVAQQTVGGSNNNKYGTTDTTARVYSAVFNRSLAGASDTKFYWGGVERTNSGDTSNVTGNFASANSIRLAERDGDFIADMTAFELVVLPVALVDGDRNWAEANQETFYGL